MKKKILLLLSLLILLSLSACTGSVGATSWPGISLSPDGELAYVAYNQQVYAIQVGSGTAYPGYAFPEKPGAAVMFYAPPLVTEDGRLIAAGYDKMLHVANADSGKDDQVILQAQNRFISSPLLLNDVVYISSSDERVYAVDLDGNPVWDEPFQANQAIWSTPASSADGATLYVTSMDHYLYALDAETGAELWQREMGGASAGTPTVTEDGRLFLGTLNNEVLGVDASSSEIFLRIPTEGWVWSSPILHENVLYFADLKGYIYAADSQNGEILWQIQPDGPITAPALMAGELLYFATESGSVVAVNLQGEVQWNETVGGKLYSSMVATDQHLLVGAIENDSFLIALNLQTGLKVWVYPQPEN
mgnify:CR=1 FL=1